MYSAKGRQAKGRGRQSVTKAERAEQQLMDMKVVLSSSMNIYLCVVCMSSYY